MLQMLIRIIKTEGLSGTFKGFAANMINTFSMRESIIHHHCEEPVSSSALALSFPLLSHRGSNHVSRLTIAEFAYFFFHSFLRTAVIKARANKPNPTTLSTSSELLLGAGAGALAQIFTIPIGVIATRQQLWQPSQAQKLAGEEQEPSLLQTGREIVQESGWQGLWTGLQPGLVLTVNPAITYGVFERIKSGVLSGSREGQRLSVGESFWIGVGSKAIATVVTYPYIFVRTIVLLT